MTNIVNPLIFRAKYFPFYKNEFNVYHNNNSCIRLLLLKTKLFNRIKTCYVVGRVHTNNSRTVVFYINVVGKKATLDIKNLLKCNMKKTLFGSKNCKIIFCKPNSLFTAVEYVIYYILKQILNFKTNIRKTLTKIMLLLINEYNLIGVKCILSGRIRGIQRAKKEIFKLGDSSMARATKRVKYCSSYVLTKYGT